ncbi:outer membrane protein assembly factor BamE domain-containing protein [Marinospirillum perlucidum]|uniref:outer membrane protein assembly factor BamE domain-containing protein n=1 Tax=Marinospirillum perlucidum TaxID=1982602 RepID=UPI000DF3E67A|nr:outer membrane protein assembly factor BamE [Marinospirillum perlucidum]
MLKMKALFVGLGLVLLLDGCATVGQPYAEHKVNQLEVGETTRSEVEELFGAPWRVGLESGQQTWTYGYYRYSLFSDAQTSDLVVRYDEEGKVASYTYNRTTAADQGPARRAGTAGP